MAFIGMDGAEHKIRQLTSQLQSKELASVRNELIKKSEILADEVKAKQALQYQMEQDFRGIESSSKDTNSLKNEVSILRQNLTNRETALAAANETIKKLEKTNSGLEYELQCAGSNSDESSRRLLEQKNKLDVEVKALKQELQRRDNEDIRLKAANAKIAAESSMQPPSGIPRLKRPLSRQSNANFFGSAPTPSPGPSKIPQLSSGASSNRRRSTSLSNTREIELQSKVSALETQLAGTRTKLDKAENQIMAVQRSAKKSADDAERKLDEANDELEFYRSQDGHGGKSGGGGASKIELEQLRKSRDALKGTVEGLMSDLEAARGEIEVLKARVEEHAARSISSAQPAETISTEESEILRARISSLESDLAKAQSGAPEATDEEDLQVLSGLRKEIRKLKKELSLTQHMVSEAEKERDEFEEELEALKAGVGKGKKGLADETELINAREALSGAERRVTELEGELRDLRVGAEKERFEREADILQLRDAAEEHEKALQSARSDLLAAQTTLNDKHAALAPATEAASKLQASNDDLLAKFEQLRADIGQREDDISNRQTELSLAQEAVLALRASLEAVQTKVDEAESQVADLAQVEELLISARAEVEMLKSTLGEMEALEFGARQERDQARRERDDVLERIKVVEADIAVAEAERIAAVQEAEHERATVQATRSELEDSKKRLASRLLEIEEYSDQLQIAAGDIAKLEQRNTELEEGLANRSTESEAQHRQEEVFQLKEDLDTIRTQYQAKEAELAIAAGEIKVSLAKIAELEAVLSAARNAADAVTIPTSAPEQTSHANLLHSKIEKLRIERDELRQTMSFAKHEHRFGMQAAEADRASALEELQRAKVDLKHRDVEIGKLQEELGNHREELHDLSAELDEIRGRLAEVSTDKHDALDRQILQLQTELEESKADRENMRESSVGFFTRHSALQAECDAATQRYSELTSHFQALQGQYSDVQRRVAEAEKSRAVALAERDECLEKLDGMRGADVLPVPSLARSTSVIVGELSAAEARMKRDMRRSSLMAFQDHAALEQAKKLEMLEGRLKEEREKVVAEQERVKRREGSIRGLLQRVEKAEWTAQLARDESDEKAEESQTTLENTRRAHEQQVADLRVELSAGVDSLVQAKAELEGAQAALTESEIAADGLRAEIARSSDKAVVTNASLADALANQRSTAAKLAITSSAAATARKSALILILTLANVQSTSLATQATLDLHIQRIASLEAEVVDAESRLSALQSAHDTLLAGITPAERTTDPASTSESLVAEQEELKGQISELQERCKELEGELETLMLDMGAAEEAHSAQMGEKVLELQTLGDQLEEGKKMAGEREAQGAAQIAELESALAVMAEQRDGARKELEIMLEKEEQVRARLVDLEAAAVQSAAAHVAQLQSLRQEMEAAREVAAGTAEEMSVKLAELETVISALEEKHTKSMEEKMAEMENLRGEIRMQGAASIEIEREIKDKLSEAEAAVTSAEAERDAAQEEMEVEKSAADERAEGLLAKVAELESALTSTLKETENDDIVEELRKSLERSTIEISHLKAAVEKANSDLAIARSDIQRLTAERDDHLAKVSQLESDLDTSLAASALADTERQQTESQLQQLRIEFNELDERLKLSIVTEEKSKTQAEEAASKVSVGLAERDELRLELDKSVAALEVEKQTMVELKEELRHAEEQFSGAEATITAYDERFFVITKELKMARDDLTVIQESLASASTRLEAKQVELDAASRANTDLSPQLAQSASVSIAKPEVLEALEYQIQELQHMCQSKENDVDVATDHMTAAVVDKNKALVKIGKLERKIVKLEKAIEASAEKEETAKNTATNLLLMRPRPTDRDAVIMAPPPIPASSLATGTTSRPTSVTSTPVSAPPSRHTPSSHPPFTASTPITTTATSSSPLTAPPSSRQPLRSVNVFDKSQMPTSFSFSSSTPISNDTPKTGSKRSRDGEMDDINAKLPAEAIMQPIISHPSLLPPAIIPHGSTRKPVKGGFTPQRNAFAPTPSPVAGVGSMRETKENDRPKSGAGEGRIGHGGGVSGLGAVGKGNVFAENTPRRNPFAMDQ